MPRVRRPTDREHVLAFNLGAACPPDGDPDRVRDITTSLVGRARTSPCTRVLAVHGNAVIASYERAPAVNLDGVATGALRDSTDPNLTALVGKRLPDRYRWRRGQTNRFRYCDPLELGLPAYPLTHVGTATGGWVVASDGTDLVVTAPGPAAVVGVATNGTVRLRLLTPSDSHPDAAQQSTTPSEPAETDSAGVPDQDLSDPARAYADYAAELDRIRADVAARTHTDTNADHD